MAKLVLIIDAGHGNNTIGKRSPDGSIREFHFNNPTAQYVGKFITAGYEDVEIHYVHDLDGSEDVPLGTRTTNANKIYAKYKGQKDVKVVYVSIHANASGNGWTSAGGIETFVYNTKPAEAVALATKVQKELITATGLANRGVKTANFHVLRETYMTAILVECGFMTNKAEAELLKSDTYRQKVAKAVVKALAEHYCLKAKPRHKPTPAKQVTKQATAIKNEVGDGLFYRVITGSFDTKAGAEKRVAELKAKGFDSFIMPYHK
jgi:N-acetylmuramoyl-L-alanine amidase